MEEDRDTISFKNAWNKSSLRTTVQGLSGCLRAPGGRSVVYHILPEAEPFSESSGGSLSRWAANTLRHDDAQVICPSADRTWNFPPLRIQTHRGMQMYGRLLKQREYRLRTALRIPIVEWLLRGIASRLTSDDILYIHNRPEYVLALNKRAANRARFKIVLHMHNDHLSELSTEEAALLRPDLTIFNSSFLEGLGLEHISGLGRTAVLYNGADEGCFHPAASTYAPAVPTVLFVGRLIPEKGAHVLIEAMRQLELDGVRVKAKIIGSVNFGSDKESAYVTELHRDPPPNVEFLPYVSGHGLAKHFRDASIFCCPSVWDEPFGMVNVEAMASGLPVVASAVGGIPEIFSRGGGVLVPKDQPAELAYALKALAENELERQRVATQALAVFQLRFRWSVIYSKYRMLMRSLESGAFLESARAS